MKRTQWIALGALALLALLVLRISMTSRTPPFLPADADHGPAVPLQRCLDCHSAGGEMPRGPDHPVGNDCSRCHAPASR